MDFDISKGFWEQKRTNTHLYKAYNILNLQVNSLTYNFESGVDFEYFIFNDIPFKKEAFVNYVVKSLIEQNCDVITNNLTANDFTLLNEIILQKQVDRNQGIF